MEVASLTSNKRKRCLSQMFRQYPDVVSVEQMSEMLR